MIIWNIIRTADIGVSAVWRLRRHLFNEVMLLMRVEKSVKNLREKYLMKNLKKFLTIPVET